MILFPNAKINLGLNILRRRPDGYHDLEMLMLPVGWADILEIVPAAPGEAPTLTCSGRPVDCPPEKNLVMKAWRALKAECPSMPEAAIYLRKIVPDGAGLGGGSSDAAFTLVGLNEVFGLGISRERLAAIAAGIGADCPFFIHNRPMLATGTGTVLEPVDISLDGLFIAIAKPEGRSVSTAAAYAGVTPREREASLAAAASLPVRQWEGVFANDFEASVGAELPEIGQLKDHMRVSGAVYSAMSGSGSAVFGIFESAKMAEAALAPLEDCACWSGPLAPQRV